MSSIRRRLAGARLVAAVAAAGLGVTACGGADEAAQSATAQAITVESPAQIAALLAEPPADLVVLDVRTPEEFVQGHLDGAVNIDFYADDFRDQLDALAKDVPYVLYCRSGNRSGQARATMAELGFVEVHDLDGGVVAWANAGYALTT